jgi:hypothetical protein
LIWLILLCAVAAPILGLSYAKLRQEGVTDKATAQTRPMQIGVNLSALNYASNQRVFANLAAAGRWRSAGNRPWELMAAEQLTADGDVKFLLPGQVAPLFLFMPAGPFDKVRIRCRFDGKGKLGSDGAVRYVDQFGNYADFDIVWGKGNPSGWIQILQTNIKDPVRNIDCREKDMDPNTLFDPTFVKSLRGFRNIRFLDWQQVNDNLGGDWSRFLPDSHQFLSSAPEGVRPDIMVRLANEANIDPWFIMPYAADDTYIRNFAQMVKRDLKPNLKVHVELGNEIWNYANPATQQALQEGKAMQLSSNAHEAMLMRYAQKSRQALKIWTEVFKGDESRLVRIVGTQNAFPDSAKTVLGYEDLADHVDALATAPYFYAKTKQPDANNLDAYFAELDTSVKEAIERAVTNRKIAHSFGKRYIAYEAGQHIILNDPALFIAIQRDPRMGELYAKYLTLWKERLGDLIVFYVHTSPIGGSGAWGLREYANQPVNEAPKWRAVQSFLN